MPFLIDTNILLRSAEPSHPMYPVAINATSLLRERGELLCIVPQNIGEFWNVYTRPLERNGLGHSASEAEAEIQQLENLFELRLDNPEIYQQWKRILIQYSIIGVKVHDARLVAAMIVHGLTHILTFNTDDFKRYTEIAAVNPSEFLS